MRNLVAGSNQEESKKEFRKISDISNQSEDIYLPRFGMRVDVKEPLTPTQEHAEINSPLAFKRVEFAHNSQSDTRNQEEDSTGNESEDDNKGSILYRT